MRSATNEERVRQYLERREWGFLALQAAKILFGVPLSLIGPLFFTAAGAFVSWRLDVGVPWVVWAAFGVLVVLPLLVWAELKRGSALRKGELEPAPGAVPGMSFAPSPYNALFAAATAARGVRWRQAWWRCFLPGRAWLRTRSPSFVF